MVEKMKNLPQSSDNPGDQDSLAARIVLWFFVLLFVTTPFLVLMSVACELRELDAMLSP